MTTLNDHAQESESRFSCLSASNPENIPDVRKEYKQNISTLRKHRSQTNRGRPPSGRRTGAKAPSSAPPFGRAAAVCLIFVFS